MRHYFIVIIILLYGCYSPELQTEKNASANLNVQLAMGYLQQNDVVRAKSKLLLAESQSPKNSVVQDAWGYFYEKTGEKNLAQQHYLLAIKFSPRSGTAQNNYGVFLCHQKSYSQALQHFILAVKDPQYLRPAQVYENAGRCALKMADRRVALTFFQKALAAEPHRATTLLELRKLGYNQANF